MHVVLPIASLNQPVNLQVDLVIQPINRMLDKATNKWNKYVINALLGVTW